MAPHSMTPGGLSSPTVTSYITSAVKNAASEPLFTGTLLYLLTRGPPHTRERLLRPFRNNILAGNAASRLAKLITVLKVLTGLGVVRRANQALNRLAWNNWTFKRKGAPFKFGVMKEEVVFITGGSSGFGYEMVKGFSQVARVVVMDVADFPEELRSLPGVHFYRCDITDTPAVEALCKEIRETHGDPSVLINNAGISVGKTVLETSNAESQKLFQVNLISHFVLIREFLPGMLRMKKGHIVTITSMASFVAAPGLVDYCCSKVGTLYLTEGIRAECRTRYPGGENICTTSIHPSWHQTGILKGSEKMLAQAGIVPDPPSRVSDVVIEQVLAARSGQVCVPRSEEGKTGVRGWPMWAQDVVFGLVRPNKNNFVFTKED